MPPLSVASGPQTRTVYVYVVIPKTPVADAVARHHTNPRPAGGLSPSRQIPSPRPVSSFSVPAPSLSPPHYSKQQRPSRREPPPPTHLLPPVASAWLFVEQLPLSRRRRHSSVLFSGAGGEMKKLYQGGKGRRVHPAPADAAAAAVALPAAVLALASALTAEEQEVLAYLLSCGGATAAGGRPRRRRGPHPPEMGCACFGCYKSFWARWDASPNRHLIHRIIDAVEEGGPPRRPHRRRRRGGRRSGGDDGADEDVAETGPGADHLPGCDGGVGMDMDMDQHRHGEYEGDGDEEDEEEEGGSSMDGDGDDASVASEGDCSVGTAEKSTVGRLVRFIGEKVWGAWN
ncbi:hypothetical protein BDA96_06G282700 [Sorghum bicolor]|nr:hypothetical protein BDA96_06G282700 [Sorghum bicolor]